MQTDMCETDSIHNAPPNASVDAARSKYNLGKWRADLQSLAEEIRVNKQTMRAAAREPGSASEAQARAHGLARHATALCLFRASLREREHAPGLSLDKLRQILNDICPRQQRHELRLEESVSEYRAEIVELIRSVYAKQ